MNETVIIALISFGGTLLGTFGGIITSGKLTNYRIEQLEKKVDLLSSVTYKVPVMEEQIKSINNKLKENYYENFKMDDCAYRNDGYSGA